MKPLYWLDYFGEIKSKNSNLQEDMFEDIQFRYEACMYVVVITPDEVGEATITTKEVAKATITIW